MADEMTLDKFIEKSIKPCPICGREPEVIKVEPFGEYYITCRSMYCVEQKHLYCSRHAAIKAWNRRVGE